MSDKMSNEREFPAGQPVAQQYVPHTRILGVRVSLLDMRTAVAQIIAWAAQGTSQYVCIRDVHGIMRAQGDRDFLAIHDQAGMVTPDGMPLVWVSRARGAKTVERVCGSDLVDALCAASVTPGLRHFFFGGKAGVAERMVERLAARYPGLVVAGTLSPPFGELSAEQDDAIVATIARARPHVVWVGLSTPKQEYWMRDHVSRIPGATLIGVGAAFDFHAGDIQRAPRWMQRSGLEWLHRLCSEPRRLWRRYLLMAPGFVFRFLASEMRGRGARRPPPDKR